MAVLILLESDGETYAVLTEQVDAGAWQFFFFFVFWLIRFITEFLFYDYSYS